MAMEIPPFSDPTGWLLWSCDYHHLATHLGSWRGNPGGSLYRGWNKSPNMAGKSLNCQWFRIVTPPKKKVALSQLCNPTAGSRFQCYGFLLVFAANDTPLPDSEIETQQSLRLRTYLPMLGGFYQILPFGGMFCIHSFHTGKLLISQP